MEETVFGSNFLGMDPCWEMIFFTFVWVLLIVGVAWLLYSAYEKEKR